jgi:RNA polymerase sigma-70 factor (ECF subfamily)
LEDLPPEFREAIVLRELEGMSYKEIAGLCSIPVGTVMSRLARARQRLERYFTGSVNKEPCLELPGK